jgi:hypothetical protein
MFVSMETDPWEAPRSAADGTSDTEFISWEGENITGDCCAGSTGGSMSEDFSDGCSKE